MSTPEKDATQPCPTSETAMDTLRRLAAAAGVDIPADADAARLLAVLQARAGDSEGEELLARACQVLLTAGSRKG